MEPVRMALQGGGGHRALTSILEGGGVKGSSGTQVALKAPLGSAAMACLILRGGH